MQIKVAMCTGDNQYAALKVAKHLGIAEENVTSRAYPNEKKRLVQKLQEQGEKVMFVGDGVNDSPVLAQADVGVAINSQTDITVQAAGIVLMRDNLLDVLNAINISNRTFKRIKINFCWAFIYNIVLVPIAMGLLYLYPIMCGIWGDMSEECAQECVQRRFGGFKLDPMWAGCAMAMSSVSVVLSSLSLKLF